MLNSYTKTVRTLQEARLFVLEVGLCGILGDPRDYPTLWDAVDAPEKQPGERGWGRKVELVWTWKNELPARYPDEIFYGKHKGGRAILCTLNVLRRLYEEQHRPVHELSDTAQILLGYVAQAPANNRELKMLAGMASPGRKSTYDRALKELQTTFQIVRINRMDTDGDTWTLFSLQYPDIASAP